MFLFSIVIYANPVKNYTERLNIFTWASFKNHWNMFLREFAKGRQKETQILTTHKIFMKTHIVQQKNNSFDKISKNTLKLSLQGSGWDL